MSNKKAQTATEYMIILAVVIIIALIVVGVLGGIPGIGGGARGRSSAAYWQTADIAITSYSVTEADAATLKIRNNLRDTITITNVTMSSSGSGSATIEVNFSGSGVLAPGETDTFSGTIAGLCGTAGDSFTSNILVAYTDDETGATYAFTGEGNKVEGTCAN